MLVKNKNCASWTAAIISITQHSIGQIQGNSNKMHNQMGTGIISHKTKLSETKQTKTSQTIDVTLIMETKGSRPVPSTTNRIETWTDKVDLTAAFHRGAIEIKIVFIPQPMNKQNNNRQHDNIQRTVAQ